MRKTWYERLPERYGSESRILKEAGFVQNVGLLAEHRLVVFEGYLPVDPDRLLKILFTDTFPSTPPMVFDAPPAKMLRRHHSLSNRQLCLFGFGNSRWRSYKTSTDALEEVTDLLKHSHATDLPTVDDTVPEPLSVHLQYDHGESIFVPPPISDFGHGGAERLTGQAEFVYLTRALGRRRAIVISAHGANVSLTAAAPYLDVMGASDQKVKVTLVYVPAVSSADDLRIVLDEVVKSDIYGNKKRPRWFALVFPEQSGSIADSRSSWVFARVDPDGTVHWIRAYCYRTEERMARIPQLRPLSKKTVAIVGCGCLGSKIAVKLAASGVGNFCLVDGDLVEPYNSVRQEYGVNCFGFPKVDELSQRLHQLNPEVDVQSIPHNIGGQHYPEIDDQIHHALSHANVIVDAVAVHGISRWLNDFAYEANVPLVSASVTNGAWSGEVVRSIPGESACWKCWQEQYQNEVPPGAPSSSFFAPGCNQPTFTGTTYDADLVASFAASMIADVVTKTDPSERLYKEQYLRWIGRDEGGFVGKIDNLPVTKRDGCWFCNPLSQ